MRFAGRYYRGHDPGWSFTSLSDAGAALTGGRFNRKGEPTLYLSLDVVTSFGECTQGFIHRLQPLTMCEYEVDCDDVTDLRDDAARSAQGVARADLACSWLSFQLAGQEAPSWRVVDNLKAGGGSGILVPSFVPGATAANINLALWRWGRTRRTRWTSTTRAADCRRVSCPGPGSPRRGRSCDEARRPHWVDATDQGRCCCSSAKESCVQRPRPRCLVPGFGGAGYG